MNTMTFDANNYRNTNDLMVAVATVMEQLAKNGYVMEFYYEDCDIYVLNYDYKNGEIAGKHLFWLNDEEAESVISMRFKGDD